MPYLGKYCNKRLISVYTLGKFWHTNHVRINSTAENVSENYTVEQVNLDVIYLINNFPSVQAGINNNGKRFAIESDPLYINF